MILVLLLNSKCITFAQTKKTIMDFKIIRPTSARTIMLTALLLVVFQIRSFAQNEGANTMSEITKALKQADENKLAAYFNSTIDLEIPGTDGTYSKTQSVVIMHDFFKKFKVSSFTLNHEGSSNDGCKYMIGTYKSGGKELRLYILLKNKGGKLLIHQLQLEEE